MQKKIEDIIKKQLTKFRIKNDLGSALEWVCLDLKKILWVVDNAIKNYEE